MDELEHDLAAFDPDHLGRLSTAPPPDATPMPAAAIAKTILSGKGLPRSRRSALAQTQMSARNARPGLLFFTGLGFVWLLTNLVVATGAAIRFVRGDGSELGQTEVVLFIVGATAALVTPLVMWVRYLLREVWPNTPRAIELMGRLRRTVLYSAAAYAIVALFLQLSFVVIQRHSSAVAHPVWALLTFVLALLAAAGTWMVTRPRG
jgi:hypothetical protein